MFINVGKWKLGVMSRSAGYCCMMTQDIGGANSCKSQPYRMHATWTQAARVVIDAGAVHAL